MNVLLLVTLANILVWGIIIGLLARLAAGQRDLSDSLTDLEKRLRDG